MRACVGVRVSVFLIRLMLCHTHHGSFVSQQGHTRKTEPRPRKRKKQLSRVGASWVGGTFVSIPMKRLTMQHGTVDEFIVRQSLVRGWQFVWPLARLYIRLLSVEK